MTELERRIEDGVHYEHLQPMTAVAAATTSQQKLNRSNHGRRRPRSKFVGDTTNTGSGCSNGMAGDSSEDGPMQTARGVFCGYRYTQDDYNRLKSAHP